MRIIKLSTAEAVCRAEEGDTLASIAERFGTTLENIAESNGTREPETGDLLFIPNLNCPLYAVRPLDTVDSVAEKFGVRPADILHSGGKLYIGQKLIIKLKTKN